MVGEVKNVFMMQCTYLHHTSIYINLRRSRDCLRGGVPSFVRAWRPDSFSSLHSGQLLR